MALYDELARHKGYCSTVINTKINTSYRVSSVYRKFANPNFEFWRWETLLWNSDEIEWQYDVLSSVESVVNLHAKIEQYYLDNNEIFKDES